MGSDLILRIADAYKSYGEGPGAVAALRGVSLTLQTGEFVAVMGPSGCGKTTLLNLAGAMDTPDAGTVAIGGRETAELDDDALTRLRSTSVGFVFQAFHLLPTLSVRENVELQILLRAGAGMAAAEREGQVMAMLRAVQLQDKAAAFPHQLSGGEMQRAAMARALIHRPALLIADEPTGNLDSHASGMVLDLLTGLSRDAGAAVLMATHSAEAAARAGRILRMRDGRVEA